MKTKRTTHVLFKVTPLGDDLNNPKVEELAVFSEEEYTVFISDQRNISQFQQTKNLFDCLSLNISNFLNLIIDIADSMLNKSKNPFSDHSISIFGCYFNNILSSYKTVLDHTDYSLIKAYGKDSKQFTSWKRIQSNCYDNAFEYRFLYRLRNYSQHIGLLPFHISTNQSIENPGKLELRIDLVKSDLLIEKNIWNQQLIIEISKLPEYIPIVSILENWHTSISRLRNTILTIRKEEAVDSADRILQYRQKYEVDNSSLINIGHIVKNRDKSMDLTLMDIKENIAYDVFQYRAKREEI